MLLCCAQVTLCVCLGSLQVLRFRWLRCHRCAGAAKCFHSCWWDSFNNSGVTRCRVTNICLRIMYERYVLMLSKWPQRHVSCGCGCENSCVSLSGFPLKDQLFQMIIRRYSDENGNMDFDNYIGCLVRLDAMCRKFALWSEADAVQKFYHDDSKDWLTVPSPHSGAFKTLDKDNNGTIKVNVQEVKSDLNYFKLVWGFWFWWREWEVNKNVLVLFSSGFSWRCILESGRGPSPSFFTTTLFAAKVIANPCTCRFIL